MGGLRTVARTLLENLLARRGYRLERAQDLPPGPEVFSEDGLSTDHVHEFVRDPVFVRAYARAVAAAGEDYRIRWRTHIALRAAATAAHLPGDFVECGVNRGFLSSAIMEALDWDTVGKRFFLIDTFNGIDVSILPEDERAQAEQSNETLSSATASTSGAPTPSVRTSRSGKTHWSSRDPYRRHSIKSKLTESPTFTST